MVSKSPLMAPSQPLCPFIKPQPRQKNQGSRQEHRHTFISTVSSGFCLLCVGPMTSYKMQVLKVEHVTSSERLTLFHLRNQYRKEGRPAQRSESTQTEPGWGWLSCTQGNVMTKQHIPQFSGGRDKPPGRGASLQCRPARCHSDTVCSSSLIPQFAGPQPHLLNWSTLHIPSFGCSKDNCYYYSRLHLAAKMHDIYSYLLVTIMFYAQ